MVKPQIKNVPWGKLQRYGGEVKPNHSSGMTWVREGQAGEIIETPSNPVDSTWGVDKTDYTFRADWVRDVFREAGIRPTREFAAEYLDIPASWVSPVIPRDDPNAQPPDLPGPDQPDPEQPPDFPAPDPPHLGEDPPDFPAPDPPQPGEQPPDFPAPDPPVEAGHGPEEK